MGRKVVKKVYKDTYARGQRDKKEFQDRYQILIELVSVKVLEDRDLFGNESELYFKVGSRVPDHRQRTPNKGTINIEKNETFTPTEGLTLYCEFRDAPDRGVAEIPFDLYERDPGKDDDHIIDTKISIPLGTSDYRVLTEKSVKVKIKISGLETRY